MERKVEMEYGRNVHRRSIQKSLRIFLKNILISIFANSLEFNEGFEVQRTSQDFDGEKHVVFVILRGKQLIRGKK